jgi:hypothetical protein
MIFKADEYVQPYDPDAPRCNWLQSMVDRDERIRRQAGFVPVTRIELQNLRRRVMQSGYDPYNSADTTPDWMRVVPPDALVPVRKFNRDFR